MSTPTTIMIVIIVFTIVIYGVPMLLIWLWPKQGPVKEIIVNLNFQHDRWAFVERDSLFAAGVELRGYGNGRWFSVIECHINKKRLHISLADRCALEVAMKKWFALATVSQLRGGGNEIHTRRVQEKVPRR